MGVQWPAEVRDAAGQHCFSFAAVNLSGGGVCLRGESPVVFPLADGAESPPRLLLRLTLPEGRVLEGIEVVQVWETRREGEVQSGWSFAGLAPATWPALHQAIGLAPPVPSEPVPVVYPWKESEIDLWDCVSVAVRRRWVIALCGLLVALAAALFVRVQPVLYRAQAQVLPVGEVDYLTQQERLGYAERVATPFTTILKSVPLNRKVARRCSVAADSGSGKLDLIEYVHAISGALGPPEGMNATEWTRRQEARGLRWLAETAEFERRRDDRVIEIAFSAEDPELAAQIANAYVDELKQHLLRSSAAYTQQNLSMARARLDSLSQERKAAEGELEEFRSLNQQLLDTTRVELLYPELATRRDELEDELALKRSLYNTVANQYELLRLQLSKDAAGIEEINRAEPPLTRRKRYLKPVGLGGVGGLLLGTVLAFGLEYVERRRRNGDTKVLHDAWQRDRAWLRRLWPR